MSNGTAPVTAPPTNGTLGAPLKIFVSSAFDSGNIEVVDCSTPSDIQLKIHPEPFCEYDKKSHFQWFYFRVSGVRGQDLTVRITNAGKSSFPEAWPGYNCCASYDSKFWFRTPTTYETEKGELIISHQSEKDSVYFAYFAPYTYTRHRRMIAGIQAARKSVQLEVLGQTAQGRDIDCLRIGEPAPDKMVVWLVARQHPGESMAEWFMEGLLEVLVDCASGLAEMSRRRAVFYVAPNLCPDGTVLGHLRTNSLGRNLNREWLHTAADTAPEVYYTKQKMKETGCDLFIDVHGDEEFPLVFLAGAEGIPSYTAGMERLKHQFMELWMRVSPDFTDPRNYYGVEAPGQADLRLASNWVAEEFKCLSLTLEMPFKDVLANPNEVQGWSPDRAKRFGASMVMPLFDILPRLKTAAE